MLDIAALDQLNLDLQNLQSAVRLEVIQRAGTFLTRNTFRRQVRELLEQTARQDPDPRVVQAAQAMLASDVPPRPREARTAGRAFPATCPRGHRHYYDKNDYCSPTEIFRDLGDPDLDSVMIKCKTCEMDFPFKLNCR